MLAKAIDINSLAVALTADVVPPAQRGAAIGFVSSSLASLDSFCYAAAASDAAAMAVMHWSS